MPRKVQRTKPIAVRLTDEEKLDWDLKAHAAGLSISELVRQAMERVRISNVGDRAVQIERTRLEVVTHLVAIEQALQALSDIKPNKN